jgi:type IV secretion system protein VirD4
MVSLFAMIRIFTTQKNLANMLSGNTIDISKFGKEKTAVYLIIPDEKSTYHFLVTTFVKQTYEILIKEAQKEPERKLPVRVNFMLDEFCNLPKIPDMTSMISASRSRNMRFILVAQSLHQLTARYGDDAATLKGNCDNWVFLTSKELNLLKEISELCGTYITADGKPRNLISVSELQRLDKSKGEALIMHSRQYPVITEIADIDEYKMFLGYEALPLVSYQMPEAKMFDLDKFYVDIVNETRPLPFS